MGLANFDRLQLCWPSDHCFLCHRTLTFSRISHNTVNVVCSLVLYLLFTQLFPTVLVQHKWQTVMVSWWRQHFGHSCNGSNQNNNSIGYFGSIVRRGEVSVTPLALLRLDLNPILFCVSCPSAIEFSAISFLLFVLSSSNPSQLHCISTFRWTLRRNFNWIRQQMNNFPLDPHCKICPLSAML